ncbi:urea ABC transporter permease subunit UrtB [Alsobacter sp. SYSU M60028]|uniref:Urea ABC transporter permease subunit UrtB n=2 Tax=Alsobacter ponti TaxID=2962936 RepID=A0ABT1LGK5_9HYPH|nr:urea ABC transporter permease subunit UrtB [Alsobacter ponti]MCP8940636.1 urea ABC transporter permease subunit UrtB [Alsobacter ponti]
MATEQFAQIEAGIADLTASGSPLALPALEALADGRLYYSPDKSVFIKQADGRWIDARTGAASAADPASPKPVRLNNRVRRALEAALGSLSLMNPDPAKRLAAAEAVVKSRDAAALPAVEAALAKETDPRIRKALSQAKAATTIFLDTATESEKVAAIETVAGRGDQDALNLLGAVRERGTPILKLAAETASAGIERRLALLNGLQNVWYGLSLGSVLLLAAIGLAITFGVMGVINMAHGEMVMLGAYTTFLVQEFLRTRYPALFDLSLPIAIPLAFLVAGAVGVALERGVIRFLYGRPLETLLATWGVSLILQQTVRTLFGANNREVGAPSYMAGSFDFFGLTVTHGRLWIVVFAMAVFACLLFVLKATSFGLKMRAVTQNRRMASCMGIRTPWLDAMTFGLGSGIAGIAGVALSQIDNVSPNLGQSYIVDSFMVVVFGGVGNLWGTLVAALTLGIANKFLEPVAGAVLGKIALLVFIILFIQKRPRGLFAQKGRAVEA